MSTTAGTHANGRPNVFVKVSGDEFKNPRFMGWLKEQTQRAWVAICIGGGTQINAAFEAGGFETKFGPLGRETKDFRERQVARDVLEANQVALQDALGQHGINAAVELPVTYIGTVLCHVNGDVMVQVAYLGYDELYVVTTPERLEKKREQFAWLHPKVQVIAFT